MIDVVILTRSRDESGKLPLFEEIDAEQALLALRTGLAPASHVVRVPKTGTLAALASAFAAGNGFVGAGVEVRRLGANHRSTSVGDLMLLPHGLELLLVARAGFTKLLDVAPDELPEELRHLIEGLRPGGRIPDATA
jgi:hypothetical protein